MPTSRRVDLTSSRFLILSDGDFDAALTRDRGMSPAEAKEVQGFVSRVTRDIYVRESEARKGNVVLHETLHRYASPEWERRVNGLDEKGKIVQMSSPFRVDEP